MLSSNFARIVNGFVTTQRDACTTSFLVKSCDAFNF